MDRATDHLVNVPPAETAAARKSADVPDDNDLALRKQRLIDAARAIDPLAPLRRNPLVTVATAAAIGVVAASPAAARTVKSLLPSILPSGVASRLIRIGIMKLAAKYAGRVQFSKIPADPLHENAPTPPP
jgi:hypothetical protein